MKKIIIIGGIILAVAIIAGSWLVYSKYGDPGLTKLEDTFSVSMTCDDGSSFVAEFSETGEVFIIKDNDKQKFMLSEGDGKRYENQDFAYIFAGEEAMVTNKKTAKNANCSQLFDPNSPPFNFGDLGEGDSLKQDITLAVSENIVGKWQSIEDLKFQREFRAKGVVIDLYDSKQIDQGTWQVFTKDKPLQVAFPIEDDKIYIQLSVSGSETDTINFKLVKLTPEELELIYMERGGVLKLVRIP